MNRAFPSAVFAVCLLHAVTARAQANTPDVPLPPDTQKADVSQRIIYDGLEMHASVFRSTLTQQQIVDFYKRQWGGKVAVHSLQSSEVVGHPDGDYLVTVQVSAYGSGSKGTIGMVRAPDANAPRPTLGAGLPQPDNTKVVNDISYPDDAVPARTVLMMNALSVDQNAEYFRSRLIANGWKDANANQCHGGTGNCVMAFDRGSSRMTLVTESAREGSQVLINILDPEGG
jgi:hypothetical protein